ncbi:MULTISPECIES: hypothetical protein [unclassified Sedimentibacter]|uniref:hypothetical protein n=1 Tax=unclassified Sedimentibacter TaxID=2649220 RepID=UPI0027E18261|nr:hypothetical protein [Sedimentibacter sp. MB35-C1]WMJ78639.1 hypothetical protein RBQ61_06855 [Sedimentibacter sp. MB35-C1]
MHVYIKDEILKYSNDTENVEKIFNNINVTLEKMGLQFSHLIVDDEVIYDNYYNYITENIRGVKKIEVIAVTIVEMINESIILAEQYAKNAIPIINRLAEGFYQKPNQNIWSQLTDLFEGIQWIIQSISQINLIEASKDVVSDYGVWNEYVQEVSKLNDIIPELENAILNKDNILIGDMLLYEIIPVFETMTEKLGVLKSEAVN